MFDFLIGFIETLLNWAVDLIFTVIKFPPPPDGLVVAVEIMFEIISGGLGIINFFLPLEAIYEVMSAWFVVWSVLHSYYALMWVLRKIPILGIK